MNKNKRCLVITNLYPNTAQVTRGMFVFQELQELKKYFDIKIISPLPWVPPLLRNNSNYRYHYASYFLVKNELESYYPRYVITPKLMRFMYGYMMYWGVKKTVNRVVKEWSPDFIIAYYAFPDGFLGFLFSRKFKIPLLVKVLGSDVNVFAQNILRRWMTRFTLRNANRVIAKSNALKEQTVSLGVSVEKISVITNGIDKTKFFPREINACRRMLNLPEEFFIFIYIGNMIAAKGVDVLLDAYEEIPDALKTKCILVMVGGGNKDEEILQRINEPDFNGLVIKSSPVSHADIPIWLGASDCLILPSFAEGYPNVLVEALACGKPVIASNVGGVPEIVQHGKNGLLVPANDRVALTNAMISFLQGPHPPKYEVSEITRTWSDVAEDMRSEIMGCVRPDP